MFYSFFSAIPRPLNSIYRRFKTLFYSNFICGVSKKNNGDEIFGVIIRERVWLENILSQLEVGGRKWQGPSRESGCAGQGTPSFGNCKYERAKRRCEEARKGRHGTV